MVQIFIFKVKNKRYLVHEYPLLAKRRNWARVYSSIIILLYYYFQQVFQIIFGMLFVNIEFNFSFRWILLERCGINDTKTNVFKLKQSTIGPFSMSKCA